MVAVLTVIWPPADHDLIQARIGRVDYGVPALPVMLVELTSTGAYTGAEVVRCPPVVGHFPSVGIIDVAGSDASEPGIAGKDGEDRRRRSGGVGPHAADHAAKCKPLSPRPPLGSCNLHWSRR